MNAQLLKLKSEIARLFNALDAAIACEKTCGSEAARMAYDNIKPVIGKNINSAIDAIEEETQKQENLQKAMQGVWEFTERVKAGSERGGLKGWKEYLADLMAITKADAGGLFTFSIIGEASKKENIKIETIKGFTAKDIPRSLILKMLDEGKTVVANAEVNSQSRETSILSWQKSSLLVSPLYEGRAVTGGIFLEKKGQTECFHDWQVKLIESYLLINGGRLSPKALRDYVDKNAKSIISAVKQLDVGDKNIIGSSKAFVNILKTARLAAKTDAPVLITGESGTGKDVIAKFVHDNSSRKAGKLVVLNCAAIPMTLFEAELFGHKKGAYTDAIDTNIGRLGEAEGGTLFFDEIGDLPLALQAKILRLFETGEYQRLGEPFIRKADVRFIAATNRDISCMVDKGKFRKDLYYRLNVVEMEMPRLKERKEDIPLLLERYLDVYAKNYKIARMTIDEAALKYLVNYEWPGNIRELQHIIEKLYITSEVKTITLNTIISLLKNSKSTVNISADEALKSCHGNASRAAKMMGVSRPTFYKMVKSKTVKRR